MNKKSHFPFFILIFCSANFSFAQSSSDSINSLLRGAGEKEKIVILSNYANQLKFNSPEKALEFAGLSNEVALKINETNVLAKNYQLIGGIHFRSGSFAKAKENFSSALNYYAQLKNEKGKAEVNNSIASINYAQGNLPAAIEGYLSSLKYFEESNDKAGMLGVLNSLGNLYTRQNNFTKANECNLRALKIYEESSDKMRIQVSYDNIGNVYMRQGNYVKAKEYYNKSLKLYSENENKAGTANTLNLLGDINSKLGKYEDAIKNYSQSLRLAEELKMQMLMVSNLNDIGEAYFNNGEYEKAIRNYNQAVELSKALGLKIELDKAYNNLADVYRVTKEIGKSKTFNRLSTQMQDSLFNDSIVKQLADISLRYEGEKKQTQIELLSKEQAIQELELNRVRQIRNVFISALSVLFILFIVLIYFFLQNKRIAKNIERQRNELQRKNIEIMEQTGKLNQLNAVKDRFFSIISHDLRNNLTTMKLYFDLISNPEYKESENKEVTKNISASVENTIDLLENLLIWAAAQIKGVPIHIQKLHLHTLTQENMNLLHNAAFEKHIEIRNEIPEQATAFGDMDMIRLVLRNLIANAIKFTRENGLIKVNSEIENGFCKIIVSDNGVGISPESIDRLFNQFSNPTTKGTGNEKGTGLGLILCKDFIERNNGRIWVESEEGKGSKFIFELPVKQ
ncbi:MAG: tetratricopeptide repeat protein [Bacteroidia bacterium]